MPKELQTEDDTDDGNKYPIATFDKANTSDWQKVTVSEVMKDTVTKIEELKFRFGSHGDSTDLVEGDTTKALPREFYIDDFEIIKFKWLRSYFYFRCY